jgi:hypothetical protein
VRLVVLYLRSRQVPAALAGAAGSVAILWVLGLASESLHTGGRLGLLAVVAGTAAAGSGLAGADIALDRTAAIAWPPLRAVHVVAAGAAVTGIIAATALAGDELGPAAQITRDAIGMIGLTALGAAALGGDRAWIPPLTWTLGAWIFATTPFPSPALATYHQVLTWMVQPPDTTPATNAALTLGASGVLVYAILGPRR